jgi:hypothetical protein
MSDKNPERESAHKTLFSGGMDVEGMDEVLALYRDLFDLAEKKPSAGRPKRGLTDEEAQVRLAEGFTLVDLKDLLPEPGALASDVADVVQILGRYSEDTEALEKDLAGLVEDQARLVELARIYLDEGEETLRNKLLSIEGVNPEVVMFVLFNALKGAFLHAAAANSALDTSSWEERYCPVCGGDASVSYMVGEGGKRHLICFRCEAHWRFRRLVCPYCGVENPEHSGILYSDNTIYRDLSANVCSECRSYIKGWRIDGDELDDLNPQIEDLKTPGFDRAVEEEGFFRGAPNIFGVWIGALTEEDEITD